MSELSERLRERARSGPAHDELDEEAADELERLEHNQMSSNYVSIAKAAALQAQEADAQLRRAEALDRKCSQFTEALLKAMTLVDELMRENARLCFFAKEPPSVRLFAAKTSWDVAMHKLLGDDLPPPSQEEPTADTTEVKVESDTQHTEQEGEAK